VANIVGFCPIFKGKFVKKPTNLSTPKIYRILLTLSYHCGTQCGAGVLMGVSGNCTGVVIGGNVEVGTDVPGQLKYGDVQVGVSVDVDVGAGVVIGVDVFVGETEFNSS
jgi:hypothetical protein